ncbi:phage tail assembly protein [Escherichia coli]|uniref:phage tail assembly protein n=1 Tax=Escherichia coli TaxID=562 RepID=UPI0010AB917A|nr:phage tail assembly protein [Escherichia coli]EHD7191583.1 phage tail assembly protein [Escherichia coli]EHL6538949.1 phage tail assembly protein [Escherichia coli]TJE92247.1 phage tail assembly protein [Escherichia coli]
MDQTEENIVTNDADAVTNGGTENTKAIVKDTVNLKVPVLCGNTMVSSVKIGAAARQVGSLRGIRMSDLFNTDVDAAAIFLERVTEPRLSRAALMSMCPEDFLELYGVAVGFLFPSSEMKKQEAGGA